jgi:hypothetical protein
LASSAESSLMRGTGLVMAWLQMGLGPANSRNK